MTLLQPSAISYEKIHLTVHGTVQGVGFRPFVFRLATELHLAGWVKNTGYGVEIELAGPKSLLDRFKEDLFLQKPKGAYISSVDEKKLSFCDSQSPEFLIKESAPMAEGALSLLPDRAICDLCIQELYDAASPRYRYPFIHCCSCGPRYSLFEHMPFDRANTTMREFTPCASCIKEYESPQDRRFFSQTICCPKCGPSLTFFNLNKEIIAENNAIDEAKKKLVEGHIVAVKNTGGFLLLARADNEEAVRKLRKGKRREKKPFALLVKGIKEAHELCHISEAEEKLLTSPQAPIVLLKKKKDLPITPSVYEESPYLGLMLASTALLILLLEINIPLVATSGNCSEEPLCINDEEAFSALGSIASYFLVHNRNIAHPLDDSVACVMADEAVVIRRARGYVPSALRLDSDNTSEPKAIAFGAELKNTFALCQNGLVYVSQHMGSLDTKKGCDRFLDEIKSFSSLLRFAPSVSLCDLHPDYFSTRVARASSTTCQAIAHHRAHVYGCMLDRGIFSPHLAICWDGIGLGEDGMLWGAEGFIFDGKKLERIATFEPFSLPGGQRAIKEPRRAFLGLIHSVYGKSAFGALWGKELDKMFTKEELLPLLQHLEQKRNPPLLCSSIGRLFDAFAALLGACYKNSYEGHAGLCIEALCYETEEQPPAYPLEIQRKEGFITFLLKPMLDELLQDKKNSLPAPIMARRFIATLCESIVYLATHYQKKDVLLTGGVMQNRYLIEKAVSLLKERGFNVVLHKHLPPGDGNISAGQLAGYYIEKQKGR